MKFKYGQYVRIISKYLKGFEGTIVEAHNGEYVMHHVKRRNPIYIRHLTAEDLEAVEETDANV